MNLRQFQTEALWLMYSEYFRAALQRLPLRKAAHLAELVHGNTRQMRRFDDPFSRCMILAFYNVKALIDLGYDGVLVCGTARQTGPFVTGGTGFHYAAALAERVDGVITLHLVDPLGFLWDWIGPEPRDRSMERTHWMANMAELHHVRGLRLIDCTPAVMTTLRNGIVAGRYVG